MSEDAYITWLARQNPALFEGKKIQMSIETFKTQLRLAYRAGAKTRKPGHPDHLFRTIFGL